ncbi:MAG: 5'-methylthioadenosine/adenosylhomocysteine nucleosidase [Betaproteobacteria bacterium]|jgi:adenosylhomocysteine nucleosidase|nr:5'-methylthioadenosine/adenosylhomocysteine nucleosidase [Betaproteobacteria bacterium]
MKPIAIVGAMQQELAGLKQALQNTHTIKLGSREVTSGTWHGQPVVLALSHIGKVAAATTATAMIERFDVTELVFTGVAGGLGQGVNVGDMVVATEFLQHDMDASPLFPIYEVPMYGRAHFPTNLHLTQSLKAAAQDILKNPAQWIDMDVMRELHVHAPKVHAGMVVSGDRFVSTTVESRDLQQRQPHALAVEMEGAAVAQVCLDYGVPFGAVRTISDRADDAATVDFSRFIHEVASRYTLALLGTWLSKRSSG